jgi:hypothetical protein
MSTKMALGRMWSKASQMFGLFLSEFPAIEEKNVLALDLAAF